MDDQVLYNEDEILQILKAQMNVYWSAPWWLRWYYKPWLEALKTACLAFAGNRIAKELEQKNAVNFVENFLDE